MKRKVCPFIVTAYVLFTADGATADVLPPAQESGWTGAAGAGVMGFSTYTGGTGTRSQLLPLVSANYKEIFYVDPLRAALFLAGSADKKIGFGLAVEPRIGFQSSDSRKLAGMTTRRNSLEGGLNLDWNADLIAISVSYFADLTHSSGGTSSRLYFYKDVIKTEKWQLGANIGIDHMSSKVSNYYFGTTPNEVTVDRPLYRPGSASNITSGFDGRYLLTPQYSIIFGLQQTNLTGRVAQSPLVETKQARVGWVGFAWNL